MTARSLLIIVACLLVGCAEAPPEAAPPAAKADDILKSDVGKLIAAQRYAPEKIDEPTLPNLYRIEGKVYSGGQPQGEPAFEALARMGVKTVISVDGATPEVELAKKHGLRYVHLPHGYDGIPEGRGRELAKAVKELPGPIYIHCHHGKHRSPAAATVACIQAGFLAPMHGLTVLQSAGTSKDYRGLYKSVGAAKRVADEELAALEAEFPETAKLPPLAEAMIGIEHTHDLLKKIAEGGWKPPADHPDLSPAHEALLMKEHYIELLRTPAVQSEPERFRALLGAGVTASEELETALKDWDGMTMPPDRIGKSFAVLSGTCKSCHREFRDVPLDEKRK